jgi:uncharacterized protein (TIGR02246 family)
MVRVLSLTAGAALLLLGACQPSGPQPLAVADSTAIAQIPVTYAAAWNKGNVDGIVGLYASDARELLPDTTPLLGSNAVRTYLNTTLGTPRRPVLALTTESVMGRQDLAVASGTFTLTLPPDTTAAKGRTAAPAPAPLAGHWLSVLTKHPDGTWKIANHAISYDAPRPAMPAQKGR